MRPAPDLDRKGRAEMALIMGLCLFLSLSIAVVATAIRYDMMSPAIIVQLVAGNEFEWMLGALLLALVALSLRRRA
jgi:hypothetical protein